MIQFFNKNNLGNFFELSDLIKDNSIDCTITSPDYFLQRQRGIDGQVGELTTIQAYLRQMDILAFILYGITRPTGSAWINIRDTYKEKCLMGIPGKIAEIFVQNEWVWRGNIIWDKTNYAESVGDRPTYNYEWILFFTKSAKDYYYNIDSCRLPLETNDSRTERIEYTGGKTRETGTFRPANPLGKNLSMVWRFPKSNNKIPFDAPFPLELPLRCIKLGCPTDGIVLDPFSGSGTTLLAAHKLSRKFMGFEIDKNSFQLANILLEKEKKQGKLF